MKIDPKYQVREMAGEHVIVMPGRYGADMTRVVALNATSLFLWKALAGRDFTAEEAARELVAHYEVDVETARRDAEAWCGKLAECGVLEQ